MGSLKEESSRKYLKKETFFGGRKLFSCNVMTGQVERVKIMHTYSKDKKTGSRTKLFYINPIKEKLYLTANNLSIAKVLFEVQFAEMAEELEKEDSDKNS